jgi:hypothetical protein
VRFFGAAVMTGRAPTIGSFEQLDDRRGMKAQRDTLARRQQRRVAADQAAIRSRTAAFEQQLALAPARTWREAADKARYLLMLFAASPVCGDPRRQKLIHSVLADFDRLAR